MLLPTKHIRIERSLLGVGADLLHLLDEPKTVSRLWDDFQEFRGRMTTRRVSFDRFTLSLALLFSLETVEINRGRIRRVESP